jgi:zinc transport system permease protein
MNTFFDGSALIFLSGILIALAGSFLGVFVISRRMALVSDALSHVALPGVGAAFILGIDIFWGALVFLMAALFLVSRIKNRTRLSEETLVGIIFTFSIAIGVLLLPGKELLESLFGNIESLAMQDFWIILAGAFLIITVSLKFFREFSLVSFSEEWARIQKINVSFINFLFFSLLAVAVAIGIKLIGTLLMSSLLIIPAAASLNISRNFFQMAVASVIFGITGMVAGLYFASVFPVFPSGPAVVLAEVALFGISFLFKK